MRPHLAVGHDPETVEAIEPNVELCKVERSARCQQGSTKPQRLIIHAALNERLIEVNQEARHSHQQRDRRATQPRPCRSALLH